MQAIVQNVDQFADWWLQMDIMLKAVESKIGQLQPDHIAKKRTKSRWGEVKAEYLDYKIKARMTYDESNYDKSDNDPSHSPADCRISIRHLKYRAPIPLPSSCQEATAYGTHVQFEC